jgi:hypothetical protein
MQSKRRKVGKEPVRAKGGTWMMEMFEMPPTTAPGELVAVHVVSRDDISTYLSCLGHQQNNDNYILRDQLMSDGRVFNAA